MARTIPSDNYINERLIQKQIDHEYQNGAFVNREPKGGQIDSILNVKNNDDLYHKLKKNIGNKQLESMFRNHQSKI